MSEQPTQEQTPETLRRHQEMFRERQKELEFLGTLDYREIVQRVNDRNWRMADERTNKSQGD